MSVLFAYMTASNRDEALRLARAAIDQRLAACANVLPPITSVYRWEGAVQEEDEVAVIFKTTAERFDALVSVLKALHSYTCPCIVALPVGGGNPDFLAWIAQEVAVN